MAMPPYTAGDRILLRAGGGALEVIVSAVVGIPARDPSRRWRLLCRDAADGHSIELPVYCGDDGLGDLVSPATTPSRTSA